MLSLTLFTEFIPPVLLSNIVSHDGADGRCSLGARQVLIDLRQTCLDLSQPTGMNDGGLM